MLNIDIAPTLLDMAGVTVPADIDGKSFLPVILEADEWMRVNEAKTDYGGHRLRLVADDGGLEVTEVPRKQNWRDSFLIERG